MNRFTISLLISFWLISPNLFAQKKQKSLDILITNARIIDGTGNPWFKGEIGIQGGKIVFIGKSRGLKAKEIFPYTLIIMLVGSCIFIMGLLIF